MQNEYKYKRYYELLYWWFIEKDSEDKIVQYLKKNNYTKIAIYGMDHIGELLLEQLKRKNINVLYAIDKKADDVLYDIDAYYPDEDFPFADLLIVTPFVYYDDIVKNIKINRFREIVSIEKLIYDL